MRLLNVTTMQLEQFFDNIPEYCTLSHTWGDEEIDYHEYLRANREQVYERALSRRLGYVKIVGACQQAARDNYQYIWIDTCCIDKKNDVELGEALRSMFNWYRNGQVCFALIEDVHLEHQEDCGFCIEEGHQPARSELQSTVDNVRAAFKSARWFTRGWTLQELIAPKEVHFFSRDWILLGRRCFSAPIISEITGIDQSALRSPVARFLDVYSIAQIMSWAANRETRRVEDIAYCLMGLFDVHMPTMYGEGTRAFARLQEQIISSIHDHTIFVWQHQNKDEQFRLLAPHPSRYKNGGKLVQRSGPNRGYSFQNTGLSISLPVTELSLPGFYQATLDVTYTDAPGNAINLYLQPTGNDKDHYFVCPPHTDRWIELPTSLCSERKSEVIVIAKDHPVENDPELYQLALQLDQRLANAVSKCSPKEALISSPRDPTIGVLTNGVEITYSNNLVDLTDYNSKCVALVLRVRDDAAKLLGLIRHDTRLVMYFCNSQFEMKPFISLRPFKSLSHLASQFSSLGDDTQLSTFTGSHKLVVEKVSPRTFRMTLVAKKHFRTNQAFQILRGVLKVAFGFADSIIEADRGR